MIKSVTSPFQYRVATLMCSSITIVLSACGGGGGSPAVPPPSSAALIAGMPDGVPAGLPNGVPAGLPNGVPAGLPAGVPAGLPNGVPAGLPNRVPAGLPNSAPADLPSPAPASQDGTAPASGFALTGYDDGGSGAPSADSMAAAIPATTYKLYVSPSGDDDNAGTAAAPFRTLARAARSARASTTVFVAPGTYAGGIKTTVDGTASGRIIYVSSAKWGARIASADSGSFGWDNRGDYVDIIGFQVDGNGSAWKNGIYSGGSYNTIRANWVHHIAKNIGCNSSGGSAIGVDSYYNGAHSDIIGNLVHDIGLTGCQFIQGIYMSTSGTIKNNVVYRVGEGAIHLWHDANNVIITNNTVTTSHTGIIVGGGDFYHTSGPSDFNRVYNNIVYDNAMGISEQGKTGVHNQYHNNLIYQNTTYNTRLLNGLNASATVSSAPDFVGYTKTGTPDLHLGSNSPAIGSGTPADAPTVDFSERPRNSSTGYDIGAYQH